MRTAPWVATRPVVTRMPPQPAASSPSRRASSPWRRAAPAARPPRGSWSSGVGTGGHIWPSLPAPGDRGTVGPEAPPAPRCLGGPTVGRPGGPRCALRPTRTAGWWTARGPRLARTQAATRAHSGRDSRPRRPRLART